jgi:diadenosine tetraphosphate (Ap4A) HIT family hydrolase
MPTLFSKILSGDIPARFVWQDADVAAFLTIAPLRPGHTLVVPRREVDQWTDADPDLLHRCMHVSQVIGRAVQNAWRSPRAGLIIAGFEVPHMHVHVFPAWDEEDFDFRRANHDASAADLDEAASTVRSALRQLGHGDTVAE